MSGAEDGRVFEFNRAPVMLGRHPEDDVFLPNDRRVSRHHARLTRESEDFFIEDVGVEGKGSANGTYLNGISIDTKISIGPGDAFLLGTARLQLEQSDELGDSLGLQAGRSG